MEKQMPTRIPDDQLPLCKYCKINRVVRTSSGNIRHRCDDLKCVKATRKAKGHFRGKKRPEHGPKVSKALKGKPKSESHKRNLKTNTVHYKKKMLENKGIKFTEDNFLELWHQLISDTRKGRPYKETCVSNWFGFDPSSLTDQELEIWYKRFNSEKSIKAMKENPHMGNGVRHHLTGLKYYKDGNELIVRSHGEKRFVEAFLERLGLPYQYECMSIETDQGIYLPDFLVDVDEKVIVIEIKGTIYTDKIRKTISGANKVIEKGYDYYFIQKKQHFSTWTEESLEDFKVIGSLKEDELKDIFDRETANG